MRKIFIETTVALTVFLFLYAATSKVMEFNEFKAQLGRSPMTTNIVSYLAVLVPLTEIVIAIMLLIPAKRMIALYGAFCLMYAFTAYITIMLIFSPYLPCSCGGILDNMTWTQHLVFNIFFVIINAIAIPMYSQNTTVTENEHITVKIQANER